MNRSLCPCLFSAEPSGNNRQRDIPGYLHMRRKFLLQLLPDMEEVYDDGSTSDEDERAIFIIQQHGTLKLVVWRTRVSFISPFDFSPFKTI